VTIKTKSFCLLLHSSKKPLGHLEEFIKCFLQITAY
jgi:hypothetical protein